MRLINDNRKTKIVCTIGRIKENNLDNTIEKFIRAGMDVARINMSHLDIKKENDRNYLKKLVKTIRERSDNLRKPVAIIGDLQGPKVRLGEFETEKVKLETGKKFTLTIKEAVGNEEKVTVTYRDFINDVRKYKGKKKIQFCIGDGAVRLEEDKDAFNNDNTEIRCKVTIGGVIRKGNGVTVRHSRINTGEHDLWNDEKRYGKDSKDLEFLLGNNLVDLLAISFVRNSIDLDNVQKYIMDKVLPPQKIREKYEDDKFPLISKIETPDGVEHIDEIIDRSYGIMVARGDLGLQKSIQHIPIDQKNIIKKCNIVGKPVITATEMLASMINNIEPTRAEATDVANAILDGTDAVMLSGETSVGEHPVESIKMMDKIAKVTEKEIVNKNKLEYETKITQMHEKIKDTIKKESLFARSMIQKISIERLRVTNYISWNACATSFGLGCKAIVVLTTTGGTARIISRFKPDMRIIAGVHTEDVAHLLMLTSGVTPINIGRPSGDLIEDFRKVIEKAVELGSLSEADRIITTGGYPRGEPGTTSYLNVYNVSI